MAEWGTDPTFWCYMRIFGIELLPPLLTPSTTVPGGFLDRQGNPIHLVELHGVIVMVARRPQLVTYAVDDGTAVIDIVVWRDKVVSWPCFSITHNKPCSASWPSQARIFFPGIDSLRHTTFSQDPATADYRSDDTGKWGHRLGELVSAQGRVGVYTTKDGNEVTQVRCVLSWGQMRSFSHSKTTKIADNGQSHNLAQGS